MGRRPVVENLRKDVKERLDLVRAKFADLKHHAWKPKRYVPEISEAVELLSKRTGVGKSTLWNSQAPYLADIKRLLAGWETECRQLAGRDAATQAERNHTEVGSRVNDSVNRQQLLDSLYQARVDLERERAALRAAKDRIEWLERERRVIEQELNDRADEMKAAAETILLLQARKAGRA